MPEHAKKLLLHLCCAPCACGCLDKVEGRDVTLFFSNSNIVSQAEFEKRLENVRCFAEHFSIPLIVDPYDHEAWKKAVSSVPDFETLPEGGPRCAACFEYNLSRTAETAARLDMNFTTTLTVSPHKSSRLIFSVGGKFPRFEAIDFKKNDGFLKSLRISRELNLYRQNFCGCEYSIRDRS